jgi:hypothetical protein
MSKGSRQLHPRGEHRALTISGGTISVGNSELNWQEAKTIGNLNAESKKAKG